MKQKEVKKDQASTGKLLNNHKEVYKAMRFLEKTDRECFYVLHLTADSRMIKKELISIGSLTTSIAHPREVFKGAILNSAARIICVHNHPSGNIAPSKGDIELTQRLIKAGDLLGISLDEHIIIGSGGFFAIKEHICFDGEEEVKKAADGEHVNDNREHDLLAAEKVATEKGLDRRTVDFLKNEHLVVREKINFLVLDSLCMLSLVRTVFDSDDFMNELATSNVLSGTKKIVEESCDLLDAATELHFKTF
ncbi:hypothetical protein BMS3Bbin08_00069 [bacterium BMS3Bbin08]|nr:hypothetical protein BMS3Bbin08_00069 [bacterium BMS3Bbin08]